MTQCYLSLPRKHTKPLKVEDFALLAQENQQYRDLFRTMTEKQAVLTQQVADLQRRVQRLENQKQEYRIKGGEYASRLCQYEMVREQLLRQYRMLKDEIDSKVVKKQVDESQMKELRLRVERADQLNLQLQQEIKKKDMMIEQLKESLFKMQREVLEKKVKMFSQMVDTVEGRVVGKGMKKLQVKGRKKGDLSFLQSKTQSNNPGSLGASGARSISFSLVSGESAGVSKIGSGVTSMHNKSIFV